MARGYYTRSTIAAYDLVNGKLRQRWFFDSDAGPESNRAFRGLPPAHSPSPPLSETRPKVMRCGAGQLLARLSFSIGAMNKGTNPMPGKKTTPAPDEPLEVLRGSRTRWLDAVCKR
jgi:hypothetical protein